VGLKPGGEIIVAGGPIQTPKLLQLSGIGEKAQLDKVGIATVVDLPGVGANFHDHAGAPSLGARTLCPKTAHEMHG
jgi:choline dehydrogenase